MLISPLCRLGDSVREHDNGEKIFFNKPYFFVGEETERDKEGYKAFARNFLTKEEHFAASTQILM